MSLLHTPPLRTPHPNLIDKIFQTKYLHSNSAVASNSAVCVRTNSKVDFSSRPFRVFTDSRTVEADSVIVATGAVAKRLPFTGSGDGPDGFWNRGISACAVCDGAAPIFRNKPLAVIGGGDSAMEEATFLTEYGSEVYIIHRRDTFRASKIMQSKVLSNSKIMVIWNSAVVEAYGDGENKKLGGLKVKNVVTEEVSDLKVSGLFFAIGHEPATKFLDGQLELDSDGYVVTKPGTTKTSVEGVFAAGDVQDKKYRQAITAAGTGLMLLASLGSECEETMLKQLMLLEFGKRTMLLKLKRPLKLLKELHSKFRKVLRIDVILVV
ncbi:thioredoxin reductase 2-like [Trifolium pratense]|uniref:thioredoxin reductase 2-like n=1 Tax=Trifolium pratense TaxID=57577 RepID=UPI001E692010|nr:thioredoxin reductase 2-like [Trifolium pratense]